MTWDLRAGLLKKQEVETARLIDFEFRLRARTMRLLAAALAIDADALVQAVARKNDGAILAELAGTHADVTTLHEQSRTIARAELIRELGDPTPCRLA